MSTVVSRPARVLIADDTADLRLIMRLALRRVDGIEIVGEAVDGFDAVEQAEAQQPDLVLLDLAMPRMGGLEALPLIKQCAPATDVIVLSAFAGDQLAAQAMAAGALAYVQKSGSPSELIETVSRAIGRQRSDSERAPAPEPAPAPRKLPPDLDAAMGRIAHELRNPAIALAMIADRIEIDTRENRPVAGQLVTALRRQVDVIDQVTMDVLTASQVRRGALTLSLRPVDLGAALRAAAEVNPDTEVTVECPGGARITADPSRLAQLLANLVANAQRHGAEPFRLIGRIEDGTAVIEVIDHGPGVSPEFVPNLFEEYTQADPERCSGAGLGLYVVRELARAHGGATRYERRGDATVFTVTLPVA